MALTIVDARIGMIAKLRQYWNRGGEFYIYVRRCGEDAQRVHTMLQ